MDLSFTTHNIFDVPAHALLLPVFEGESEKELDGALGGALWKVAKQEGFAGKADQTLLFHTHGKVRPERIILLGLGSRQPWDVESLRLAIGRGVRTAAKARAWKLALRAPDVDDLAGAVKAAAEGFVLGAYRFDRYRTQGSDAKDSGKLSQLVVGLPSKAKPTRALQHSLDLGTRIAEATNWARDMVNEPAGVMTPERLAAEARSLSKGAGLQVSVSGRKEIERLKMGMYLGVAQGSALEPKLLHLHYRPKGAQAAKRPPVALVGKAITFDSGGLSLKTAEGMVDMKTDMAGAAAVLGAMRVVGHLKPPFPVHALIGACENMPSGTAYRPGDVLISRLGKTVEVTNTDAEGRLVLGDVLAYANDLKPALLIDLATLTGACMVALGHFIAGVFGEDENAVSSVLAAAKAAGEPVWRLPVSELQKDALRSDVADMKNSGERWGGAINAAIFLREFVGRTPWVHLDIAGPSQSPKERGYLGKGPTGMGVRTLVALISARAAQQA